MSNNQCPECGYPDTKDGKHFKGIYKSGMPCPHCQFFQGRVPVETLTAADVLAREQRKTEGMKCPSCQQQVTDLRIPCPSCGVRQTNESLLALLRVGIEKHKGTEEGRRHLAKQASKFLLKYLEEKNRRDDEVVVYVAEILAMLSQPIEKAVN